MFRSKDNTCMKENTMERLFSNSFLIGLRSILLHKTFQYDKESLRKTVQDRQAFFESVSLH